MFRKFYDAAPAEAGAAPTVEAPVETPSVASQMAKSGRKISGDEPLSQKTPAPTPPPKTEATSPTPTSTEIVKPALPATESPKSEVKPEPAKPAAAEEPVKPAPIQSWQEALRQQKPDAVLKELGFDAKQVKVFETLKNDPKMMKFLDVWSSKGDITGYIKAAETDYSKMAPEEVMRHSLRERNLKMSAEDFNELYAMKVIERYKLDGNEDYTATDIRRAKIELAADAEEHRDALIKQQQDYLLSAAPDQVPDNSAEEAEVAGKQMTEAYQKYMSEDTFVKDVVNSKTIKIGEGEEAFKYSVDPQALTDILYDSKKWANAMFKSVPDEQGNGEFIPDSRKQILVAAMAKDSDGFLKAFATHHQSLGANKSLALIENASTPGATPSKGETASTDPAEKMAKSGRIVNPGQ